MARTLPERILLFVAQILHIVRFIGARAAAGLMEVENKMRRIDNWKHLALLRQSLKRDLDLNEKTWLRTFYPGRKWKKEFQLTLT